MINARFQGLLESIGLLAMLMFSLGCGAGGVDEAQQVAQPAPPPPPNHSHGGAAAGGNNGSGATGGSIGSTTETSPPEPPAGEMLGAAGVSVTEIILYQGVSRPLMKEGQVVSGNTPVVAKRDALLRVFYQTDSGYDGQPVTAKLTIDDLAPIVQIVTLGSGSSEANLQSTINFDVPGANLTAGASYRVDVLQSSNGDGNPTASFPSAPGERSAFEAKTSGGLNIKLVAIQYNADGSGRLPDTSGAQLKAYEALFYGMFPVEDVVVTVRSKPMAWSSPVFPSGNGWAALLNALVDLRNQDGAAFDTYYYGIFAPANSLAQYCGVGKCLGGLAFIGKPGHAYFRASIGVGFSGSLAADIAVHELGHLHGRKHAPCGTAGEPSYPHDGAGIGVYGYDLVSKTLYSPNHYVDMMSYCNPSWISDYTFTHLFNHANLVNGASIYVPPHLQNATYHRLLINPDGTVNPLSPIKLERPVLGQKATVTVKTLAGVETLEAELLRYDHIDGGMLLFAPTAQPITAVTKISVDGKSLPLSSGSGLARPPVRAPASRP